MKTIKFIICVAVALVVTGCGILKKDSKIEKQTSNLSDTVTVSNDTMREIVVTDPATQIAGEWTMLTIDNKKISALKRPFITFDFAEKRFYGNNGCNIVNGTFSCDSSSIVFDNMISTRMACDNETPEHVVMKVFNDVASVKLFEKNGIRYLHFVNKKMHTLAVFKEQNLNFMNGAWTVEEINGQHVTDENVKLVIDLDQLKLHGNSGCNIINGTIYIDYMKDWGVQFQQLISTMKMCENIKTETALRVSLEVTETCKKINDSKIALYDNKGQCVAVLKRLELKRK